MKPSRAYLLLPLLWAAPSVAQTAPDEPPAESSSAAKAADAFSLDLPADDAAPENLAEPAAEAPPPRRVEAPASRRAAPPAPPIVPLAISRFSIDTPIIELIADPRAKAVLDKYLPGMSSDKNLDKFRGKSLRELQPLSGGRLTDALLAKTGTDLAAIRNDYRLPPGR